MSFEQLQKTWQHQPLPTLAESDRPAWLRQVKAESGKFDRTIWWRDFRETLVALLLGLVLGGTALVHGVVKNWGLAITSLIMFGLAASFFVDRRWQAKRAAAFGETVLGQLDRALFLARHQCWLLRNVLWSYLLPIDLGVGLIYLQIFMSNSHPEALTSFVRSMSILVAVSGFIYWFNQQAVKKYLQPRVEELSALRQRLLSLGENAPPDLG